MHSKKNEFVSPVSQLQLKKLIGLGKTPYPVPFLSGADTLLLAPSIFDTLDSCYHFSDGPEHVTRYTGHGAVPWKHSFGVIAVDVNGRTEYRSVETYRAIPAIPGAILTPGTTSEPLLPPERVEGCLIGNEWLLVNPKLFDSWEARGLFRQGPDHYWQPSKGGTISNQKHRYGQLWGIEQVNFEGQPVWQPGEALWANKRVQTYYPLEGEEMGSTDTKLTPGEFYDQKIRALVERTKDHDYISPTEFRQLQKNSIGSMSSILKDYDAVENKLGVLVESATLKYTGRKVKTFQSKVPSIPNPLPPSAFTDYEPIAAENFDVYLRPSGLTGLREVAWEEGPFDGVAIRLSGFWFARWGKVKGRGRVVSYVAMPTERYKEGLPMHDNNKSSFIQQPNAFVSQKESVESVPNAIYALRDAEGMEVTPKVFDWYAKGGTFVDGPFSFTKLAAGVGGGMVVKKLYGRLKGGIILNAFERTLYVEPKPEPTQQATDEVDDWDEDQDEDEGEEPMIHEKPTTKLSQLGPEEYFRVTDDKSERLVVMVRVPDQGSIVRPSYQHNTAIAVVIVADGRTVGDRRFAKVGAVRWMLPGREVEKLELTEKPAFTIEGA